MAPPERFLCVSSVQRVDFDPPGGVGSTPGLEPSSTVEAQYGAEGPRGVSQDTRGVDGTNFEIEFWGVGARIWCKKEKKQRTVILGVFGPTRTPYYGVCRVQVGLKQV